MLFYKIGDLLKAQQIYIAHQVNCQGVMGAGVAKAIKEKYSKVYKQYKEKCMIFSPESLLGYCQKIGVSTEQPKVIFNLFGQLNYGYRGKRYTSYAALAIALNDAFQYIVQQNERHDIPKEIAVPFKMGCDRGGADWEIVETILEDLSGKYKIDVYIYSINGY